MSKIVQIVCACKRLVEVVDNRVVEHEECPMGGARYVPSRPSCSGGPGEATSAGGFPGGPKVEIIARGSFECSGCGEEHRAVLAGVRVPDPSNN